MTSKIQKELEAALAYLVERFNAGKELNLVYAPTKKTYNRDLESELDGEYDHQSKIIYVYAMHKKRALEVLFHEYLEYILETHIVRPWELVVKNLQRTITRLTYESKETFIDKLVKSEVQYYQEQEKNT